jgi:hypothetical protein
MSALAIYSHYPLNSLLHHNRPFFLAQAHPIVLGTPFGRCRSMIVLSVSQMQTVAPSMLVLTCHRHKLSRGLHNIPLNHRGRPHSSTPAKAPKATWPEHFHQVLVHTRILSTTEVAIGERHLQPSFRVKVLAAIVLHSLPRHRRSPTILMLLLLTFQQHTLIQLSWPPLVRYTQRRPRPTIAVLLSTIMIRGWGRRLPPRQCRSFGGTMGEVEDSPFQNLFRPFVVIQTLSSSAASAPVGIASLSFVYSYEDSRDHIISHEPLNPGGYSQTMHLLKTLSSYPRTG